MRANLHYILCQSTNEDEFIKGPLYTNVLNGYIGGNCTILLPQRQETALLQV